MMYDYDDIIKTLGQRRQQLSELADRLVDGIEYTDYALLVNISADYYWMKSVLRKMERMEEENGQEDGGRYHNS